MRQMRPDVDQPARAGARVIGEGGQAAGVERADRGAAQDVERRIAAEIARDVFEDVLHDADFVGAARGAAGEHECYLAATVGRARHPWSQGHAPILSDEADAASGDVEQEEKRGEPEAPRP